MKGRFSRYFFNWKLFKRPPASVNTARNSEVSTTTSLAGRAGAAAGLPAGGLTAGGAATWPDAGAGWAGWACWACWAGGSWGARVFSPMYMKAMKTKKLKPRAIKALFSMGDS